MSGRYSILIINGPSLNLIGARDLRADGSTGGLDDIEEMCREQASDLDIDMDFRQSNLEGEIVTWIGQARRDFDAIILNTSSYSFTSQAIADAIKLCNRPVIEVCIENIHRKSNISGHFPVSSAVYAVISGLGPYGYLLAMDAIINILETENNKNRL